MKIRRRHRRNHRIPGGGRPERSTSRAAAWPADERRPVESGAAATPVGLPLSAAGASDGRAPHPDARDADLTMPGMVDIVGDFLDALDLADVTLVVTDWGGALFLTDIGRDKRVARLVICPSEAFDNFPPGFPARSRGWPAGPRGPSRWPCASSRSAGCAAVVRCSDRWRKACPAKTLSTRGWRPAWPTGGLTGPRQVLPHQIRRRRPDPGHQQPRGI